MKPTAALRAFLLYSTLLSVPSAYAGNTWDGGGGDANWTTAGNWDFDTAPSYGTLTFAGSTNTTNTVDANYSMNQLLWTGTSAWTLNSSGGSVISLYDNGGVQAKIENQSTGLVTINAPINFAATAGAAWGEINAVNGDITFGSGGTINVSGSVVNELRFYGSGRTVTINSVLTAGARKLVIGPTTTDNNIVILNAANSYSGNTEINVGTLQAGNNTALGTSTAYLGNGGATFANLNASLLLNTSGLTVSNNIVTNKADTGAGLGTGIRTIGGNFTSGTSTFSGTIALNGGAVLTAGSGGTVNFTNVISNGVDTGNVSRALTINAPGGTVGMSGSNSFTGQLTVANGTLSVATINNVSANGTLGNSALAVALGSSGATGTLAYTGSTASSSKPFSFATGGTGVIDVTTSGQNLTLSGLLTGSGGFTKRGDGILTLTANSTGYSGLLTVEAGTLKINGGNSTNNLGAGTLALNGGVLDLATTHTAGISYSRNTTVGGNAKIITERSAAGAGLTYTLGTLGIGSNTLTVEGGNVTSGTAGLTFGATTFSGNATFNVTNPTGGGATLLTLGALTHSSGTTITKQGTGALTWGTITLSGAHEWKNDGGGTFTAGAVTGGANTLTLSGTGNGLTTLTGGLSFSGAGGLIVSKSGTLGTTISGGTITLGGTGGITVNSGASLFTLGAATVSANQTWTNNSSTTAVASGILGLGSSTLTLGGGNWQFGGANTATASTINLNAGNLIATVAGGFGSNGNTLSFGGGNLELRAAATTYTGKLNMTTAGTTITVNPASLNNGVTHIISGAATLGGGQTMEISAGSLTNPNTAYGLTLSGNKTFTGNSTYTINGNGNTSTLSLITGTIDTGGATRTLTFNTGSGTGTRTATISGAFTGSAGTLVLAGSAPVTIGALTTTANAIQVNSSTGGVYTFNGASTFTGGVTLSSGTLRYGLAGTAGASGPLGNGGIFTINGGVLDTAGATIVGLNVNPITLGGDFAFSTSAGTAALNTLTLPGAVSMAANRTITLNGLGALTLSGKLTNTADSARTLTVSNGTGTGATSILTIGSYDLTSFATARNNIINGDGRVTISGVVANGTGAGSGLTYSGSGVLTLGGANTFTGGVTLSSGTLNINSVGVVATSGPLGNGGAFLINGGTIDNTSGSAKVVANVNAITLGANLNFSTASGTGSNNLTLPGTVDLGGVPRTITTNGAAVLTLTGQISNGGALTKEGTGGLTLSNNSNSYTGGTFINAGILTVTSDAHLGNAGGGLDLNGGRLAINATSISSARIVTVTGTGSSIAVNKNNSFATSGKLTGSGELTLINPGGSGTAPTFNFNSTANDFTGTLVLQSGTAFSANSFADSANNIIFNFNSDLVSSFTYGAAASAPMSLNSRAIEINASGALNATIQNNNTTQAITINTNLVATGAGAKVLGLGAAAGPTNLFAGNITDGTGGGTIGLTKSGLGIWVLSGTNGYTGATLISAGTLQIGAGSTTGSLSPSSSITNNGTLAFNRSDALTQGTDFAAGISGTGAVIKNGASTVTFSSANTYSGTTTISAGKIVMTNALALQNSAYNTTGSNGSTIGLDVSSGLSSGTLTLGGLAGSVNLASAITAGYTGSVTNLTLNTASGTTPSYSAAISDATTGMTVTKTGAGTQTLLGNNTFTGDVIVNAGILKLGGTNTFGDITVNGSTLALDGTASVGPAVLGQAGGNLIFNGTSSFNPQRSNTGPYNKNVEVNGTTTFNMSTQFYHETFSGVLSGDGTIIQTNANGTVTFSNSANTFTGMIRLDAATPGTNGVIVHSLADSANPILFNDANNGFAFAGGASTSTSLLFNSRTIQLATSGRIENNNTDSNKTITINTDLAYSGTGTRTLTLGGTNTGTNTFGGDIANNGGSAVSLSKAGVGTWTVSSTNSFTGSVTVSAGRLVLSGTNAYTGATNISGGTLEINSIADYGTDSSVGKGTAGVAILVGGNGSNPTLTYTGDGDSTDRQVKIGYTGNSSGGFILNNGTGALTFTASTWNQTPGVVASGTPRPITLGGTYSGGINEIQGAIVYGTVTTDDYAITKTADASIWKLSGANTYTGATLVNGGTLVLAGSNNSAGVTTVSAGTLHLDSNANGGLASGNLNLNGNTAVVQAINADRTITNQAVLNANPTFSGDYSLSIGNLRVNNGNRAFTNNIVSGESLNVASIDRDGANNRNLIVTGTGHTVVAGGIALGSGTLTKNGTGLLVVEGTGAYTGATTVTDGTLIVDGNISTSVLTTVQTGATIGGSGTVGDLTIDAGGFFSPGNSPGITTVDGNYIQNGTLIMELDGLTAGTQHDQVIVNGTVTLNGAINLAFSTFTPVNGDLIFILLNDDIDPITGTFTGLAQGAVAGSYGGFDWQISYLADSTGTAFTGGNDVALMAVTIPEPRAALLGGLGMLMLLRRRRD